MTLTRFTFAAALCAALSLPVLAADKPNFSGKWSMNKDKSDFGSFPMVPEKIDRTIDHKEDSLSMETTQVGQQGEVTMSSKFKLDGSESENDSPRGKVKSVAKWDGSDVVITSTRQIQDMSITSEERWQMAADSKSYIVTTKITGTPMGDIVTKVVMEKK
jgi:hypothetical protein